jgi:cyclopropane fatty-acyl-phospholipid synthase-like methyltransferase
LDILENIHTLEIDGKKLDEEYKLTEDGSFLDIGSGFGKPVYHAAARTGR